MAGINPLKLAGNYIGGIGRELNRWSQIGPIPYIVI